jgi:hypothetical protein
MPTWFKAFIVAYAAAALGCALFVGWVLFEIGSYLARH